MASSVILTRPLNIPSTGGSVVGLSTTTINGQPMLTLEDSTRSNKVLSVSEQVLIFAENRLSDLDWIRIANTSDADSGYIADFDGTVVSITAHCENTGANSKDIRLFVDSVDSGVLGTLAGGANATINNQTVNIDFAQGQRLRLRADDGITGNIEDTIIKMTIKWHG